MSRSDGSLRPRCGTWHGDDRQSHEFNQNRTSPLINNLDQQYFGTSSNGMIPPHGHSLHTSQDDPFSRQQAQPVNDLQLFEEAIVAALQERELKIDEVWNFVATRHIHLTEFQNWRSIITQVLHQNQDIECDQKKTFFLKTDAIMTLSLTRAQVEQLNNGESCLVLLPHDVEVHSPETPTASSSAPTTPITPTMHNDINHNQHNIYQQHEQNFPTRSHSAFIDCDAQQLFAIQ